MITNKLIKNIFREWGLAEDRKWMANNKCQPNPITFDEVENIIVEANLEYVLHFEREAILVDFDHLEAPKFTERFYEQASSYKIIAMLILADREMRKQ